MAGGSPSGEITACPGDKTEVFKVFKTQCGKLIVVDEFLNFISDKMRTLDHNEIVMLATNNFSSEWIAKSKGFLFEVCPTTTQRKINHTGKDKDTKNVKACLSLFNEFGENMPMFVSHRLDKLPPVGFGSLDASALLRRVEQLGSEVAGLRRTMEVQAEVNENLTAAMDAVNRRMAAVEKSCSMDTAVTGTSQVGRKADPAQLAEMTLPPPAPPAPAASAATAATESTQPRTPAESQPWSLIVSNGIKKLTPKARPAPARGKREQRKRPPGIIGTSAESRISVITTKRVNIFATRFSPDVDAETLRSYLSEKLANKSVACRKIESRGSRYGSFHVTADCKEVADMFSPQIWPAGVYVRRYFEPRGHRVSPDNILVGDNALLQSGNNEAVAMSS